MKAIVIDEPWIGLILAGQKTWEMRKGNCGHRGPVALIRKGSGTVVGTANIVDSLPPLVSAEAYSAAERHHLIPAALQEQARLDGWATPWVMEDAKPLASPVPYRHPYGAVIWVNLEPEVAAAVAGHAELPTAKSATLAAAPAHALALRRATITSRRTEQAPAEGGESRVVTISGGNLRNNHIYLPLEFFPADAIGGKNKQELARRFLRIEFRPGRVVSSDIDGTKRILRDRSATADFLSRADVAEGERVVIRRNGDYDYSFEKYS